ncbi:hypothetical protein [Methylocella tundrae]|uniref:hypothetical protein n=1 Tax=Methylocella tundrae TaxID=227605 RepID=UPI0018D54044|nr:hypothetical protein [Methylocella tundrae]
MIAALANTACRGAPRVLSAERQNRSIGGEPRRQTAQCLRDVILGQPELKANAGHVDGLLFEQP